MSLEQALVLGASFLVLSVRSDDGGQKQVAFRERIWEIVRSIPVGEVRACGQGDQPAGGSSATHSSALSQAEIAVSANGRAEGGRCEEFAWDRQAALATLAKRTPVSCSVETDRGKMTLTISDGYRTGLMHYHFLYGRWPPPFAKMAEAGIHLHVSSDLFLRPDAFDPAALESNILEVLAGDPDAYVMVGVSAKWWGMSDSPEDGFSIGDVNYRDGIARTLRSVGEYLRTHDMGKVVVGVHLDAAGDGQFYHVVLPGLAVDTSSGNTTGFREWLREKYGNDVSRLRAAWQDAGVTFDTAEMTREVGGGSNGWLRENIGAEKHTMDTRQFVYAVAPVRLIQAWSAAFKEGIGKPVVVSAWRADAATGMMLNVYGSSALMSGPGKLEMRVGVCEYAGQRETDKTGLGHATWSSYALNGVLSMRELDNRPPGVNVRSMGSPSESEGLEGFRAQIRRDLGAAATRGQAAWYFEMADWYSRDDTWPALEEGARIMAWAHRQEAPSAIKDMAVFVDEEAGWRSGGAWPLHNAQFLSRAILNRSGVPYDLYFLDHIRHPDLPDYKVYVLLLAATLNPAQLDAIKQRVQRAGKVLVVQATHATPGIGSAEFHASTSWLENELKSGPHTTYWLTSELTPQALHEAAVEAGIGTLGVPGHVTHVGAGVAVVHRLQPGPATVTFERPVDLIELDGVTVRARHVTQWEPDCELRRADVIFYREADGASRPAGANR